MKTKTFSGTLLAISNKCTRLWKESRSMPPCTVIAKAAALLEEADRDLDASRWPSGIIFEGVPPLKQKLKTLIFLMSAELS